MTAEPITCLTRTSRVSTHHGSGDLADGSRRQYAGPITVAGQRRDHTDFAELDG